MIFVMASGLFESIMDKLQFHYDKTPFKYFNNQIFWDPKISWRNKWKDGELQILGTFLNYYIIYHYSWDYS